MGFLGYLRDVMSGRIAKSNELIGNHGVRICKKLEVDSSLLGVFVWTTAYYTTDFLVELLFGKTLMERFKYRDGTEEPNPFKDNLDRLDEKSSYEMVKLVAGNLLACLFAEGLLCDDETRINIPELRNQFLSPLQKPPDGVNTLKIMKKYSKNVLTLRGSYSSISP